MACWFLFVPKMFYISQDYKFCFGNFSFERALQAFDSSVTVPYWDSILDSHLGDEAVNNVMWSDDFLGTKKGQVVSGPCSNWTLPWPIEGRSVFLVYTLKELVETTAMSVKFSPICNT